MSHALHCLSRLQNLRSRRAHALLLALVMCATLGCVSAGDYRQVMAERDALSEQSASLREQLETLETENQSLGSELIESSDSVSKLRETYDSLVADLQSEIDSGQIQIEQLREGLRVNVPDEVLFPKGSAELDEHGRAILLKVSGQIGKVQHRIEVAGHTDNLQIRGHLAERYPTNWELGAARAARVVRLFEEAGIEGSRLLAVSKGEHEPLTSNHDAEGRAQNRRIEIRLLPDAPPADAEPTPYAEVL